MRPRDKFLPLDGLLTVYSVTNAGQKGRQPVPGIKPRHQLRYQTRRITDKRRFQMQQLDQHIDALVRVHKVPIKAAELVRLTDGKLYTVLTVQSYLPERGPELLDITLAAYDGPEPVEVTFPGRMGSTEAQ